MYAKQDEVKSEKMKSHSSTREIGTSCIENAVNAEGSEFLLEVDRDLQAESGQADINFNFTGCGIQLGE